ncbi:2541_t:CDS:2 [Funneliformis geosporum]|uniref:10799_t:CDS:1 n=1 Tax=Funneliformis geosporum TaxID=1117311 RepID=A0A9W4SYR6_9GLOM|nr:10799_t:CDS:2 [Funneliformis geosporum]CAI2185766.1 2541_t:CDS:2 [Funneliformis geosporum]
MELRNDQLQQKDLKSKKVQFMSGRQYKNHKYLVFFFIWLLLLHLGGLFLFTRGFLLTRLVLDHKSQCSETPLLKGQDPLTTFDSCWYPTQFKKAVVIIVDALRFDFAASHTNDTIDDTFPHYLNKLPIFHELLNSQPSHALLFQFIADAPTTTLQRLKALTTGTLPTFIDAGSNFAGSSIEEDNLIDQLFRQGKKIAFMGDDTWVSLFPDQLEKNMTHPFPSFNVWDLHTVDNGILNLLGPTLKRESHGDHSSVSGSDWDVLIAHFLGVDHCGHRYGPDHPAMSEKLNQMDMMIRDVVEFVDEDTIVLVMGDHGMDPKGDHGGDSDNEVESALFMYSKKQLIIDDDTTEIIHRILQKVDDVDLHGRKSFTMDFGKWRSIPQIDFIPTFSLLLGLPIPFNNLGSVIPELFLFNSKDGNHDSSIEQKLKNLLNVTRLNAEQVYRYVVEYARQQPSSELSKEALHILKDLFDHAESQYSLLEESSGASSDDYENLIVQYLSFLRITLSICRRIWAQFDLPLMISGIGILIASCICTLMHILLGKREAIHISNQTSVMHALVGGIIGVFLARLKVTEVLLDSYFVEYTFSTMDLIILSASFGSVFGFSSQFIKYNFSCSKSFSLNKLYFSLDTFLAILFLILHSLSFASNSYTVFEDRISVVLLQTFGIYTLIKAFSIRNKRFRKRLIIFSFVSLILIRIAAYSTICREEQLPNCTMTFYESSENSVSSPVILLALVAFSVIMPFIMRRILLNTKSFNGIAPLWINWALRAGLMLSAAYWVMDNSDSLNPPTSSSKDTMSISDTIINQSFKWGKNFLVRMAFGIATLIGHLAWWTNPLCLDLEMINLDDKSNKSTNLPNNNSKRGDKHCQQTSQKAVEILGFANTYGASYFIFLTIIYLLLIITQQPMGGLMMSIALCQIIISLELIDAKRGGGLIDSGETTFLDIVVFSLCGTLFFFSTGHQATIPSIQWSAGFIGIDEANFTITPILVTLNALSSQILFTCAIPLLVFWNKSPTTLGNSIYYSLTTTILYFILYNSVITTSTAICAAWFRRHLMVWKVFAPRFMLGEIFQDLEY